MLGTIKSIPLSVLLFVDTWNLHPWDLNLRSSDLEHSFTNLGILHPPIVISQDLSFIPLAGYKRLQYYRSCFGQRPDDCPITCFVVAENTPKDLLLDLILCDQQSTSPLSLPEKARFLSIASNYFSEEDIIHKYFDRLQLKKKTSTFKLLKALLIQDEVIIRETHSDRISENMLVDILQLKTKRERTGLVNFFIKLNLGVGKQKKFFNMLRDISRLNNTTIDNYLEREDIVTILQHKQMNIPQVINHLGKKLEQDLSPQYTFAEKEFTEKVKTLTLPPHCTITHSPFFEKDCVTLCVTFDSFENCSRYLQNTAHLHKIES